MAALLLPSFLVRQPALQVILEEAGPAANRDIVILDRIVIALGDIACVAPQAVEMRLFGKTQLSPPRPFLQCQRVIPVGERLASFVIGVVGFFGVERLFHRSPVAVFTR